MSCRNQRDCAREREYVTRRDCSRECPTHRDGECPVAGIDQRECPIPRECECPTASIDQCECQQDFESLLERGRDRDCDGDNARERMLLRVQRYGFMTDDLRLYLNTHPDSQEALCTLKRYLELKREAKEEYEQRYGALTLEAMEERCRYDWIEGPWPWEKEV